MVKRSRRRYILQTVTAVLQIANLAYFQRKIQLSGFSAYPDISPSQLIQISGALLNLLQPYNKIAVFFPVGITFFFILDEFQISKLETNKDVSQDGGSQAAVQRFITVSLPSY